MNYLITVSYMSLYLYLKNCLKYIFVNVLPLVSVSDMSSLNLTIIVQLKIYRYTFQCQINVTTKILYTVNIFIEKNVYPFA